MSTDLNPMVFVGKLIRQKSELGSPEGPSSILQLHKDLLHGSSASLPRSSTKVWLLRKGAMQQEKAFQSEAFCKTIFPEVEERSHGTRMISTQRHSNQDVWEISFFGGHLKVLKLWKRRKGQTESSWWLNHPFEKNPRKTNMAKWKIPIDNRKYIFKWWMSHCHVSFRGVVNLGSSFQGSPYYDTPNFMPCSLLSP